MKGSGSLQLIYSLFLGLVVVGFVGIGINTFYAGPDTPWTGTSVPSDAAIRHYEQANETWSLNTSMILLVAATIILLIALVRAEGMAVISNGLLLGGLFTMVYAVIMSISAQQAVLRFVVIAVALAVTVLVGWIKFVRRRAPVALEEANTDELAARLTAVENRLASLRQALND